MKGIVMNTKKHMPLRVLILHSKLWHTIMYEPSFLLMLRKYEMDSLGA